MLLLLCDVLVMTGKMFGVDCNMTRDANAT